MADSRKPPSPDTKRSPRDRDAEGFAARREREREAASMTSAASEFANEEITGQYEGEELEEHRKRRPPDERIGRLEKKSDEFTSELKEVRMDVRQLTGQVSDVRSEVSGAVGKLQGQEGVLTEVLGLVRQAASAKAEVEKAHGLANAEVVKAKGLADVEVNKEQKLDTVEAAKTRRDAIMKIVGAVFSGGMLIELLHRLGVL